jgi:hypothetical protein
MSSPTLRVPDEAEVVENRKGSSFAMERMINLGGAARHAMPAGHPVSWGAITAGTWLEGRDFDDVLKGCGGVSRPR